MAVASWYVNRWPPPICGPTSGPATVPRWPIEMRWAALAGSVPVRLSACSPNRLEHLNSTLIGLCLQFVYPSVPLSDGNNWMKSCFRISQRHIVLGVCQFLIYLFCIITDKLIKLQISSPRNTALRHVRCKPLDICFLRVSAAGRRNNWKPKLNELSIKIEFPLRLTH